MRCRSLLEPPCGRGLQAEGLANAIDAATAVGHILPTVQTGNLHIAVTDLTDSQFFVSFMRMTTASEDEPFFAYERQFTQLDMPTLFAMPAPEVVSA